MLPIKFKGAKEIASAFIPPLSRRRPPSNWKLFPSFSSDHSRVSSMPKENSPISVQRHGTLLQITLNRPGALNALSCEMISHINEALETASKPDSSISCIVLNASSTSSKGIWCAGGDVKSVVLGKTTTTKNSEDPKAQADFFQKEYTLIHKIARFPKPIIAIADGSVIGGGAGLFMNAHFRLATASGTTLQMPECKIGFFTDASGTHFLSKLPWRVGYWMAASGEPLPNSPWSLYHLGLVSHVVQSQSIALEALIEAANGNYSISRVLDSLSAPIPPLQQHQIRDWKAKGAMKMEEFAHPERSLISQIASWKLLDWAAQGRSLEECLEREFQMAQSFCLEPEFEEGVRARLVEKRNPKWTKISEEVKNGAGEKEKNFVAEFEFASKQVERIFKQAESFPQLQLPRFNNQKGFAVVKGNTLPSIQEITSLKDYKSVSIEEIARHFPSMIGLEQHIEALLKSENQDSAL